MASQLLPEFFTLLGVNLFLMQGLLCFLLDDRVPKILPYGYQIAALAGYGHLMVSRQFFLVFTEYMRFWYSFLYLVVSLASIAGLNIYFLFVTKRTTLAKVWFGAATFPTTLISIFFVSNYSITQEATLPLLTLQVGMVASIFVLGAGIFLLLKREIRQSIENFLTDRE